MTQNITNQNFGRAISQVLMWLSTMKQSHGYGGPIAHYWGPCLDYIGPGQDWRYEGLIISFLTLYKKTKKKKFLYKAVECADFISHHVMPDCTYSNDSFESNPSIFGHSTVHSAAVDIGLLELAKVLKSKNISWRKYFNIAKANIVNFHIKRTWDTSKRTFMNTVNQKHYVPNKIATACEALLLLDNFLNKTDLLEQYVRPSADFICSQQVRRGPMKGGIYQEESRSGHHRHVMTYYTSRCILILLKLYEVYKEKKYLNVAKGAGEFINSMDLNDGGFSQEFINKGRWQFRKYPILIAGSADIVRSMLLLKNYGVYFDAKRSIRQILNNIDTNGGIRTAFGIKRDSSQLPSMLDVLHVVGWNDKVLRLFSGLWKGDDLPNVKTNYKCMVKCSDGTYVENLNYIVFRQPNSKMVFAKRYSNNFTKLVSLGTRLAKSYLKWSGTALVNPEYLTWRFVKRVVTQRGFKNYR